jgi:hypothetical protein
MSAVLSIAAIGGHGPRATAVNFVKVDGVRPWAWVSNDIAAQLAPGMVLRVERVSEGSVQSSYTKDGIEVELKVPKVQLFLGGTIEVDAPEAEPLPEATFVVSDAAAKYRAAYAAKQAGRPTIQIASSDEELI